MVNLTLAVDGAVLRRARLRAIQEDTSVNAEVRAFLAEYADHAQSSRGRQAMSRLIALAQAATGGGMEDRNWTRDDLHER